MTVDIERRTWVLLEQLARMQGETTDGLAQRIIDAFLGDLFREANEDIANKLREMGWIR